MLKSWRRLDYVDGTFKIIFPPSLAEFQMVRAHHIEILKLVRESVDWRDSRLAEEFLFGYKAAYLKMCEILGIKLEGALKKSLHSLLISEDGGLSGLENLMGYTEALENNQALEIEINITTGDYILDLYAELYLGLGSVTNEIASKFSPQEVSLILNQMSKRQRGEEAIKEAKREKDLAAIAANQKDLEKQLKTKGFIFPDYDK